MRTTQAEIVPSLISLWCSFCRIIRDLFYHARQSEGRSVSGGQGVCGGYGDLTPQPCLLSGYLY